MYAFAVSDKPSSMRIDSTMSCTSSTLAIATFPVDP
jgi:hypothetical protein